MAPQRSNGACRSDKSLVLCCSCRGYPFSSASKHLIIHGSAHRGANGVAMPTDEDDQDGHFFYNHPERGAYFAA